MNMGVAITAGPGMSGSGSVPVGMTAAAGVHPGTVGSLGQGPGSGIGISSSSSSSLGGSGMGASTGTGTMPPVGLDFVKVSCLVGLGTYIPFFFFENWRIYLTFLFLSFFFSF